MDEQLKQSALDFHEFPVPGKIQVSPTKPLATQRDLALAYSPGVAAPCLEIEKDPLAAYKYTARGNLVAVISNGTAVLGLGNIGALAGKPVMEGKGVLFKKFAGIDVFDIEVDELDPDKFINVVAALEPTFGGINLEDIKAPECFYIEQKLRERMNIPVFHDDQHGTAIISTAAILNGLRVVEKNLSDVRMVVSGAGAAAIACMNLLVALGMQKHNIVVCDSKGVIYKDREPNMAERPVQMMASSRTAFASGGRISGSGFARARIIGARAIFFTISWVSTFGPEQPRKISAPSITSSSVRLPSSSTAYAALVSAMFGSRSL